MISRKLLKQVEGASRDSKQPGKWLEAVVLGGRLVGELVKGYRFYQDELRRRRKKKKGGRGHGI